MSALPGVERMSFETFPNKAMGDNETDLTPEELEPIDGPICPYTKSICHTPYLDCYNDCPHSHRYDDW